MAESLHDGEFWLPSQFLTDDDILLDKTNISNKMSNDNKKDGFGFGFGFDLENEPTKPMFPFDFSYGSSSFGHSSSDLSSPVESVVGSTESESDEEDFIAGLTLQMAHSTLEGDLSRNHHAFGTEKTKGRFMSGSPQSTLCTVGSGCGCRQDSGRGSPNCQSQVSSPPGTWDLLYAAAGEITRMHMNEESYGYNHNRGLLGPPRKPSPVSIPVKNHGNLVDVGFYSHHQQSLSHQKLKASQFQHLKQQQIMKQQLQQQQQASSVWPGPRITKAAGLYQVGLSRVRSNTSDFVGSRNPVQPLGLSPSAWPPLQQTSQQQQQQQNGSGMRAVFLGATGGKRGCTGTGVFLPRRINNPTENRKKPACSTALLPAKVVQALNLNFDEMVGSLQPRFGSYALDSDSALRYRHGQAVSYQKRNIRSQPVMNHEIRLPQEWTY